MRELFTPFRGGVGGIGARFGSNRGGGFSPSTLFAGGEQGAWYDPSDMSTLWQDSAGTTPVTASGQPVGLMLDKSGRGNHATQATAASRPTKAVGPLGGVRNLAVGSADVNNSSRWAASITQSGITATRIAQGTDVDGLPYADVRYAGVATATFQGNAYSNASSRTPASIGSVFTTSCYVQRIAGTVSGVSGILVAVNEENSTPAYLTESDSVPTTSPTETLISVTRTCNQATVANAKAGVTLTFVNGATIDVTFRIKGLQFEAGPVRTAFQTNVSAFDVTEAGVQTLHYLAFDGVDDFMVTGTITPGVDKVQVFAGVRKLSDAARGMIVEANGASGIFGLEAPTGASPSISFDSKGTVGVFAIASTGFASPVSIVLTGLGEISTYTAILRANGAQVAQNVTDQGTGNYGPNAIFIGRRAGTSLPFNGNIYGLTIRFGANLSAGQIAQAETYMAAKTGVTL